MGKCDCSTTGMEANTGPDAVKEQNPDAGLRKHNCGAVIMGMSSRNIVRRRNRGVRTRA